MQTNNIQNSLTEHIQSVMQICRIWNGANSRTFQDPDIKFSKFSEPTLISRSFLALERGKNSRIFNNFPGGGVATMLMVCSWSHAHRHEVKNLTWIVSVQLARHLTLCNSQLSIISFRHLLRTQVNTRTYSCSQSAWFVTVYTFSMGWNELELRVLCKWQQQKCL